MDLTNSKYIILSSVIIFFLLGIFLYSPLALATDVTIIIREIKPKVGTIRLTLFDNPLSFKKRDYQVAFAALEIKSKSSELRITFHDIPVGKYALSIHHDENDNDKMDKEFLFPKEGYAFSDHWSGIGAPSFDEAALKVERQNISIIATMHY